MTRLSELLGRPVVDQRGDTLGVVHDVLAVQSGPLSGGVAAAVEVTALVVGVRGVRDRLGLSPTHVQGPLLLRLVSRARHPTDRIPWDRVTAVHEDRIVVRSGRAPDG